MTGKAEKADEKITKKPAKTQRPTVGRIVRFLADGGEVLPAIITKVNEGGSTTVNLRLFTNSDQSQITPLLTGVAQGKKERQWNWPPREGE